MNRYSEKIKQGVLLITYAVVLVLLVVYCKDILRGVSSVISLFKSFLIGIVIAFVLDQPCEWLCGFFHERLHLKKEGAARYLSVLAVYLAVVAVIVAVIGVVIPQLAASVQLFASNISEYLNNLQAELDFLTQRFGLASVDLSGVFDLINANLSKVDAAGTTGTLLATVVDATGTMMSALANLFIGIAFSVYLLGGKRRILRQADRLMKAFVPKRIYRELRYLLRIIVQSFQSYIVGQSIEAVILGSLCGAGMLLLRLDYAGVVSVVVGITAMIPILGAYIGGAVAVVLLFMVSPIKAGIFLLYFVILQQVENNVIYPRVVGKHLGLPGIWVLLAITVGGKLGGVVGMLFGVPTMTVIYTLLKNSVRAREREKGIARVSADND